MTEDLITRARAALDGVTPGLWVASDAQWPEQVGCCPLVGRPYSISGTDCWNVAAAATLANAHFIAAARDLVPALVDEVEQANTMLVAEANESLNRLFRAETAEAKVEKLVEQVRALLVAADGESYAAYNAALEATHAALAEIEGGQK